MSRFDLAFEQDFTSTDTISITHNLNRYVFNVRLVITTTVLESESLRYLMKDILLDPSDPLNKCTILLTSAQTGKVQIIAEDTIQSPYYAVADKLQSQIGSARFPIQLIMNGTVSNNDYVSYSNLVDARIRFPTNSRLSEITWDNSNTSVDFDIQFFRYYADGTAYSGNPFYTYEVRNVDYGSIVTDLDFNLAAGDYIRLLYKDQGSNCSDLAMVLWCYKLSD